MKTLIVSDLHLTHKFDKSKYDYLVKIINGSERIILNGDFWDGYLTTLDKFIKSPWAKLFPLLKNKKCVYIYGNHDRKEFCDERVNLFSDIQTESFEIVSEGKKYRVEHGHKILPYNFDFMSLRFFKMKFSEVIYDKLVYLAVKINGEKFFKIARRSNSIMENWVHNNLSSDEVYICGHTHLFEASQDKRFYNTGAFHYGLAQYLFLDQGEISYFSDNYLNPKLNI